MAKGKYRNKKKQLQAAASAQAECCESAKNEGTEVVENLVALDFERQAAQEASGAEGSVYGLWGPIWKLLRWYNNKKSRHTFKKNVYLWLMLFLGWMGGHRYYQGRWKLGLVYTLFCWTGVPFVVCVTDFMEVFPLRKDGDGMVTL